MATEPTPRSYQRILGDMIASFTARRGITSLKVAAPTLSFLETAAQSDVRQAQDVFQALAAKSFRTAEGEALVRAGRDEGVEWTQDSRAFGLITIGDSSFTRISDLVSSAVPAPIPGTTDLAVADASGFPPTGSVYVGRGTDHPEGPLAYTSKTSHGSYWTLTLSSPTVRFHDHNEGVVVARGGERVVAAGTVVRTPRNDTTPVTFSTLYRSVLPDGEIELTDVPVVAQVAGSVGNVAAQALREFDTPPFSGATVSNPRAFTTGTSRQSVAEFRETVAKARASRSRATPLAVTSSVIGISDGVSRISSATFVRGTDTRPPTIYVDDGTGYEEVDEGVAAESLVVDAVGGERSFTLTRSAVAAARLVSGARGPFRLRAGSKLTFDVGGVATTHTVNVDDYRDLRAADPFECAAAMNADPQLNWSVRTAPGGYLSVEARSGADEYVENVVEDDDANDAFSFPTGRSYTLNLYRDGELLHELGSVPTILSNKFAVWGALSGSQTLILKVDKTPSVTYTFSNSSFVDAGTSFTTVGKNSVEAWAKVIEAAIPGITASVRGDLLAITSNLGANDRAKLEVVGGTLVSNGVFQISTSSGQTSDYVLDRPTGELTLRRPLAAGSSLEAGSADSRGVVRGDELDQLDLSSGAKLWLRLDGASTAVSTGASAANTMTLTVGAVQNWGLRLRLNASANTFSNVSVGDLLITWDSAFPSDVRTHWYAADVASDGSWVELDRRQMCSFRADHTATVLADGTVLLVGGWSTPGKTAGTASAEIYDPVAETFTPTAAMSTPRVGHSALRLANDKVFVFGGQTTAADSTALSTGEVWDPATGLWTAVATSGAPSARHHHCAALGDDSKVYVYGGRDASGNELASGKVYDPTGNTWSSVTAMSQARSYFTFDRLSDNQIYAVGGQASGSVLAAAESYDRTTDTWTNAGTIQAARQGHRSVVLDSGKLFVVGGSTAVSTTTQVPSLLTDLYTVAVGWSAGTSMNRARAHHGLAKISGGKVVAGFGHLGTGTNYAEVYDPAGPSWTATAAPKGTLVRSHCTASTVASGYVVFCGGRSSDSAAVPNASAEKYRVSNDTWSQPEAALDSSIVLTTLGLEVSRGSTRPVVATVPSGNDYTADTLADELGSDLSGRGAYSETWRTSSVAIKTASALSDGQVFVAGADVGARSVGFSAGDSSTTSSGHPASLVSSSDTSVPNFLVSRVVRSGSTGAVGLAPGSTTSVTTPSHGQLLVGLRGHPDGATTTRFGQNVDHTTWPTSVAWDGISSGLVEVGVRTPPDVRWIPGDRTRWSTPYLFGTNDTLVAVLRDSERGERRYTSRTYRPTRPTGSYSSRITLRDASGTITSLATGFGLSYDFRDHRILMRPRVLSHPADAGKRILWRWWRHGADRDVYVRYGLPDAPDSPQTVVVSDSTDSTTVTVKLEGGAAKTGANLRGSTRIGVAAPTVTSGVATAVFVVALSISSASRTSNVTTLTLSLPSGVTDHGIAANDLIYLYTTHPNYGSGTFKVTSRTSTTVSFADAAADSGPDASVGTVSRDFARATLGSMPVAAGVGDFFRIGSSSSVSSYFTGSTVRLTAATDEHLIGKIVDFGTTQTTTLNWGYLKDPSAFKIWENPARTATQVAAAVSSAAVTATVTGTGSGQIDRSTAEELGASTSSYHLVDGENWISGQVDPATTADHYEFDLKAQVSSGLTSNSDWSNESVFLCPSSAQDVARWLRQMTVSGLSSAAEVVATAHRQVQISSKVQGSTSTLQLSGTASSSAGSLVGDAYDCGSTTIVTVAKSLANSLPAGSVVSLVNTSTNVKSVFTSTTTLVSVTAAGKFTFGVNAIWTAAAPAKSNVVVCVERHGGYVCLQDTGLGTALDLAGLAAGDWVVIRAPTSPTSAPQASAANLGAWRVVAVDAGAVGGGALWIENAASVPQDMAEVDVVFPTRNSVMPGDTISVSAPVFDTSNYGTWTVTVVGDAGGGAWTNGFTVTVDVSEKTPVAVTPGTALGSDYSLIQVADSVPYRSVRTVVSASPHPTETQLARLRLSPDTGYEWVGEAHGTILSAKNKLGFDTATKSGSDAYRAWTGLISQARRVLQGDSADPASYPGYESAKSPIEVRAALHRRIKIALQVRLSGVDQQAAVAKIRSAVAAALTGYRHGRPIPISEAIEAAASVDGVDSVVPITTYDTTHDLIAVQPDEKVVVYPDEDVSVTVVT